MLEISRKNCYKCNLETIIKNNSQYFWINLKDFEVETERCWIHFFNKYGNSSTLKYRKELTPNIHFQPDRIFVRNDLFEKIIKSWKATNTEFVMLKKKFGICPYGVICDEQIFILMPEIQDNFKQIKISKKSDQELIEESDEELIEELVEELIEIKRPKK